MPAAETALHQQGQCDADQRQNEHQDVLPPQAAFPGDYLLAPTAQQLDQLMQNRCRQSCQHANERGQGQDQAARIQSTSPRLLHVQHSLAVNMFDLRQ